MDSDFRVSPERTPESLKANKEELEKTNTSTAISPADDSAVETVSLDKPKKHHQIFKWPPTRKEYIMAGCIGVLAIVVAVVLIHADSKKTPVLVSKVKTVKAAPKPTTVPSTLTGLPVAPSLNAQPVTAVMIENTTYARPQSGLSQAGVVFEALAEGGVTRFMALYQDTTPTVGPIRSVRPYYEQWALGFDASIAHVGGSTDALNDITAWGVRNLDEFANGSSYYRITSREAPHNVYSSISTLNQLEASKGYSTSTYTGFARKAAAPLKTPTVTNVSFDISSSTYNPSYVYDAQTNSYNRSEDGTPQTDANNNQQLSPSVVIAMVVPWSQGALDTSGAYYSDYQNIGSGPVYVFQDGMLTQGTWNKPSNNAQITFTLPSGKPLQLDPGQTWITAVANPGEVSYSH